MDELDGIFAAAAQITEAATQELGLWTSLGGSISDLQLRVATLNQTILSATTGLELSLRRSVAEVEASEVAHGDDMAAAIETQNHGVTAALAELKEAVDALQGTDHAGVLKARLLGLLAAADEQAVSVHDEGGQLTAALATTLEEQVEAGCENLGAAFVELADDGESGIQQAFVEGVDHATSAVEEAVARTCNELREAHSTLNGGLTAATDTFTDEIAGSLGGWATEARRCCEGFARMQEELDQLARNLQSVCELAAMGVQSAGTGISAASSCVEDAASIMRGVQ